MSENSVALTAPNTMGTATDMFAPGPPACGGSVGPFGTGGVGTASTAALSACGAACSKLNPLSSIAAIKALVTRSLSAEIIYFSP